MIVPNRFCACSFRSARYVHNSPVSVNVFNLAGWTSLKYSRCNHGQAIPRVPNPTIKLTLEDDSVLECAVLTTFDVEGFGEYIALIPLDKNGKNKSGETFLFRYHEEDGNPVINNIEREDEYMAAAESFQNFIENLPHENEIDEELEEEPDGKQSEEQDEDIFAE